MVIDLLGSMIVSYRFWDPDFKDLVDMYLFFLIEDHEVMAMVAMMMMTIKQRRQRS